MKSRQAGRGRLTRSVEFERVYRQGRSCANRHLVLYTFANESSAQPRVGLSVSRKVGGAVQRNKVKRALREAVDDLRGELGEGLDAVVVARSELLRLVEADGTAGVREALAELVAKARPAGHEQRRVA